MKNIIIMPLRANLFFNIFGCLYLLSIQLPNKRKLVEEVLLRKSD